MLEEKSEQVIIDELVQQLRDGMADHFKNYYAPADMDAFAALMEVYYTNVPQESQPEYFLELVKDMDGDFTAMSEYLFNNSLFDWCTLPFIILFSILTYYL